MNFLLRAFTILINLFLFCAPQPCWADHDTKYFHLNFDASAKKQRTLLFTSQHSLGEVLYQKSPSSSSDEAIRAKAEGKVQIPAGRYVTFNAAPGFFRHPFELAKIPSDGFDCVVISALAFEQSEIDDCDKAVASIGKLSGIIKLSLDRSSVTDRGGRFRPRFS